MDKLRVYIQSAIIPLTQVNPVLTGEFSFEKESGKIYYRHQSKDAFRFTEKEDYELILTQTADECADVTVIVEQLCGGDYAEYWRGTFTVFTSTINYSKCWIEAKPKPQDGYQCLEDALKDEYNIFNAGDEVTATPFATEAGNYETATCVFFHESCDINPPPYAGCLTGGAAAWCVKSETFEELNSGNECQLKQTTTWHREVATVPCENGQPVAPPYASGWQLLEDNCGTSGTATWWRCPNGTGGGTAGPYEHGRRFSDVLQDIVGSLGCGLTVKSDFFGVNPEGDAPANGAYSYAAANLQAMTVHQKSDVKRPDDTNESSEAAWELKAEEFFSDLYKWFNVWYDIIDGVLVLEHYSYFTSVLGWDLSGEPMEKQVDYSGNENIRSQKYYYADKNSSAFFKSQTITYDCGEEEKDQPLQLFSADLVYIENPTFSENIADEGFVLIANDLYQGEYIIKDNNRPLAWANILPALHPWGRLYKSGKIAGAPAGLFESWLPYIKQEPFKTDYCCGQEFNPQDLITTDLGVAVVNNATHNLYTGRLELELTY